MGLFQILLFLHVIGAIIAFGPGFAAMVVGPMVAKEPQHAQLLRPDAARDGQEARDAGRAVDGASPAIAMILVTPAGAAYRRLDVAGCRSAIVLYVIAIVLAFAWQTPNGRKLVELTSTPPAPGHRRPNPEIPATAARPAQRAASS